MTAAVRGMVAGDHHRADPGALRACDRVSCLGTRRIDDADQSGEREIVLETFVGLRGLLRERVARQPAVRDPQRPQRPARERVIRLEDARAALRP